MHERVYCPRLSSAIWSRAMCYSQVDTYIALLYVAQAPPADTARSPENLQDAQSAAVIYGLAHDAAEPTASQETALWHWGGYNQEAVSCHRTENISVCQDLEDLDRSGLRQGWAHSVTGVVLNKASPDYQWVSGS